ncbi:hypothetical protein BRARA_F02081 [Brassica rapa]|uniref:Uncharacterized protein n=1 Tax=Brassica campestris TaxID=3711 RepID=A0A397Z9D4_BRACM|nr:hypothetical protein BRARA_F02081 [Brassica rapa]
MGLMGDFRTIFFDSTPVWFNLGQNRVPRICYLTACRMEFVGKRRYAIWFWMVGIFWG